MSKRRANLAKKKWFGSTYAALRARVKAGDAIAKATSAGRNIAQDGKRETVAAVQTVVLRRESQDNTKSKITVRPAIGLVPPTAWRR